MPQLKFSRTVHFSPKQMLDLVADLNAYPDFLPNCSAMNVSAEQGSPTEICDARMHISFGPINQSYLSEVTIDRHKNSVTAISNDDPFSHLKSEWNFEPTPQGTKIEFFIDFGFSNRFIAAIAEPAFAKIQGEILSAFILEAERRYR